jgi:transcriptional regulator with XRE-family HTH domain
MTREHLASLLRAARLDADLTQTQLAKKLKQPQSYVSKYESGEQRLDLVELDAICKALHISLDDLVRRYRGG